MTVGQYITATGLEIPTVQGLLDVIAAEQRAAIDPNLDTSPESPIGQLNGIFASHEREGWEALAIAYNGFDPDAAESFLLDALCAITGTFRAAATPSSFIGPRRLTIHVLPGALIPAGTLFSQTGNPAVVFRQTENADNTLNVSEADIAVAAVCTQTGPISCPAGTLAVIQTPVVGLVSVTNVKDAILGTLQDTDAVLRVRRVQELEVAASGNPAAVTAALLAYTTDDLVKPILSAITYENTSDLWDADGRPPHSIEALVYDGISPSVDNDTIAQIVWDNRGGGIATFGNASGTAIDYLGIRRTVLFSRPVILPIKLSMFIECNESKPQPSIPLTKLAMVAAHDAVAVLGTTTLRWSVFDSAAKAIQNVLGCDLIQIGTFGGSYLANFTNYPIPVRTKTTLDTSAVSITYTGYAP